VLLIRNSEWSRKFWGEVSAHATTEVCLQFLKQRRFETSNLITKQRFFQKLAVLKFELARHAAARPLFAAAWCLAHGYWRRLRER